MIGAYYGGEMIGFIMLGNADNYGITGQIISKLKYRDKVTNNALIGKAVEVCAKKNLAYLVYLYWTNDSLAEFKRRCGFDIFINGIYEPETSGFVRRSSGQWCFPGSRSEYRGDNHTGS